MTEPNLSDLPRRRQVEDLLQRTTDLKTSVDKEARAARRGRIFLVGAMLAFLAVFGISLSISLQNRQIINRLEECTTAGEDHDCYNEGQQRTAQVVRQLIQGQVVITICATQFDTATEIQSCVDAKLGTPR